MTNIWNKNEIITPISEYNLLYVLMYLHLVIS
jgi:hypothetical protein